MEKKLIKKEVVEVNNEVLPLTQRFENRSITTPKEMTEAVSILSDLNKILDRITADKEKITKPLNETLKEVRGRYKPAETQLAESIAHLRNKISEYQTKKLRLEKKAEEKIVNDKRGLKLETMERKFGEIERVDEQVITDAGLVKFKEVKQFEVMDITLLPIEYILPNEVKIRESMKDGVELLGVKYYLKQVPVNFR